jgi:serine/threonine protein kinase
VCAVLHLSFDRDISPSNIVACNGEGFLLDYHVACAIADCNSPEARVTGKAWYQALSLKTGRHSVSTDLESLFYSVIDMSSDGHAVGWKHASNEKELYQKKFTAMLDGNEWEKVLSRCGEDEQPNIRRLHDMFFEPASRTGMYQYTAAPVTAAAFINACAV